MVDKRVIARGRSDQSNLAQTTGLLRLRLAMTASDFSIIVKSIDIFQQSLIVKGLTKIVRPFVLMVGVFFIYGKIPRSL